MILQTPILNILFTILILGGFTLFIIFILILTFIISSKIKKILKIGK